MNNFKFRAEALRDVQDFLELFTPSKAIIYWQMEKDVECEIETVANKDEIVAYMEQIVDSHVMIQTLRDADEYTGKRYVEGEKFYRKCDCCGDGMDEGYVIGDEYYCSDLCLDNTYDTREFLSIGEEDSENYWTEWRGDYYQYIFTNGEVKEIE